MHRCFEQKFIVLIVLLLGFGRSLTINCVFMNNQPCTARPTLIDLNPGELHYYPFTVSLYGCDGSCNTVEDLFVKICVPNKTKDLNFKVFKIIKGIN